VTELRGIVPVAAGAFAAADGGARWKFHGALTMDGAAGVLEAADALPLPSAGVVDFSGLLQADSAALAVIIALKRRAHAERHPIMFAGLPASLMSLAVVYGVDSLIAS
jgi:phospholipid transport system transporter-binding protein